MYDKYSIDRDAERQGIALDKMHKRSKDKRVRLETSEYNKDKFDKLFKEK